MTGNSAVPGDSVSYVCSEVLTADGRMQRWFGALREAAFDASTMMIGTDEARLTPRCSTAARQHILMSAYNGDYHTDVTDLARLSDAVTEGKERIFFWGNTNQIATLRDLFAANASDPANYRQLQLGTATFIDQIESHGEAVWELSRTASTSIEVPALAPNLHAILSHFQTNSDIKTLYATPRNRKGVFGAKSGIAIQRMHQREICSAFLGFAPWYVMQLAETELLEYREIFGNPCNIGLFESPHAMQGSFIQEEYCFVNAILSGLKYVALPKIKDDATCEIDPLSLRWTLVPNKNATNQQFQPVFVRAASTNELGGKLQDVLPLQEATIAACIVLRVSFGSLTPEFTQYLREHYFALCAVEPPRCLEGAWTSVWARPHAGSIVTPPYYAQFIHSNIPERDILEYLIQQLPQSWPHVKFATDRNRERYDL